MTQNAEKMSLKTAKRSTIRLDAQSSAEDILIASLQCLLAEATEGGVVSLAVLQGHIPLTSLPKTIKKLESQDIVSPANANNQRTINMIAARAMLTSLNALAKESADSGA